MTARLSPAERRRKHATEQLRQLEQRLAAASAVVPGMLRDVRELLAMVEPEPSPNGNESEEDDKT